MKDPEEKEIMAYVAGLIDGDGSIGIRVGPRGKICPLVQLHNSVKQVPLFLNKLFGGTLACDKPRKEGNRLIWKWMLQGEEGCEKFLSSIVPHLVAKKDSAEQVLFFLENPDKGLECYESCKRLNISRKVDSVKVDNIKRGSSNDPFFWAYVAGIMDTDGSFSIERSTRKPCSENRQKSDLIKYRPRISLTMVSERSILYILSNCEFGSLSIINAKSALRGSAYRWSISARKESIEFLKKCVPYLQCKAIQAIKLLNFCRAYVPTSGMAKVPDKEKEFRESCYQEIIMLNNTPS